jgi:hypothetical protein
MGGAATSMIGVFAVHSASAAPTNLGAPVFWNTSGTAPITGGGSATQFELGDATGPGTLPGGGDCPGDTSTGGYQVWSYLTFDNGTNGAAPTTLSLESSGGSFTAAPAGYASEPPTPAVPLADPNENPWGGPSDPEITAVQTGQVINLPIFAFSPFYTGDFAASESAAASGQMDLFPGTWDLGIACTAPGSPTPTNYWNVQITFTAVPTSVDPNGYVWAVVPPVTTPEAPMAIILPLSALGVAGIGFLVLRRKRRPGVAVS